MAAELDVRDDFATVLDGLEPVTVRRRGSSESIDVAKAWRYSSRTDEFESGGAQQARSDVVWQFPWNAAALDLPRVGDVVLDATDQCWTILAVERLGAETRVRCHTRNLHLAFDLNDRVDVQQAMWDELGSGPEIVGWHTVRPAVPARFQPDRVTVDNMSDPATSTATYRVVIGEQLELTHDHRLVDSQGTIYQLVEYAQAERIDVLPVATVVKQTA